MKCEAPGAQKPRHIKWIGEVSTTQLRRRLTRVATLSHAVAAAANTAQRCNSLAQPLVQGFPSGGSKDTASTADTAPRTGRASSSSVAASRASIVPLPPDDRDR